MDVFNREIDRYKARANVVKLEGQAFNAGVKLHNFKADSFNLACAKKYYADDMEEARKRAEI